MVLANQNVVNLRQDIMVNTIVLVLDRSLGRFPTQSKFACGTLLTDKFFSICVAHLVTLGLAMEAYRFPSQHCCLMASVISQMPHFLKWYHPIEKSILRDWYFIYMYLDLLVISIFVFTMISAINQTQFRFPSPIIGINNLFGYVIYSAEEKNNIAK